MEYSLVTGLGRLDFTLVRYTDTQAHRHTDFIVLAFYRGLWVSPAICQSPKLSHIHTSLWGFLLLLVVVVVVMVVLHGDGGCSLPLATAVVIVVSANTGTL
jgi:hypothetical protein